MAWRIPRNKKRVMIAMVLFITIACLVGLYHFEFNRSKVSFGGTNRKYLLRTGPSEEVETGHTIQAGTDDTDVFAPRQELTRGGEDPEPKATSRGLQTPEQLQTYLEQRAVRVKEVDCLRVFRGDPQEMQKALRLEQQPVRLPTDAEIHALASDCSRFLHHYGFLMDPLTDVEKQFPIAFSILAYRDSAQAIDLLRTVYRPQNVYCIHVDKTSSPDLRQALESASRCFPNVFMASRSVDVQWGTYSVLEPDIVCMGDLWRNKTWKYFINLTGQEFPLKTNYELVRILTTYNGANDIAGDIPDFSISQRWNRFLPAPHNITVYKGAVHIAASRAFVDYVLHTPQAQDLLRWCQSTAHASEHFFNSLNYNPHLHVPGGYLEYLSKADSIRTRLPLARYKSWVPRYPCPGEKVVRRICILNVLDLPRLYRRQQLFANKFHAGYSRLALRCLAEELHNRTRNQTLGHRYFNVSRYEQFILKRQTYELYSDPWRQSHISASN